MKKQKGHGSVSLRIVRKYHPEVTKVVDAKQDVVINVTSADGKNSIAKDHGRCAMAVACQRQEHADGAIISVRSAYVVKGKTAYRYRVPESVSREVVSFDRNTGFNPGSYRLQAPAGSDLIGRGTSGHKSKKQTDRRVRHRHITTGIRTSLLEV